MKLYGPLQPQYLKFGETYVSMIGKVGSTSLVRSLLDEFPESKEAGQKNHRRNIHATAPRRAFPKEAVLLIRHPLSRFVSACEFFAFKPGRVDWILEQLERETVRAIDYHFRRQRDWVVPTTRVYRFEDHIAELKKLIGLKNVQHVNKGRNKGYLKISAAQRKRILDYYADDLKIWDATKNPGVTCKLPVVFNPVGVRTLSGPPSTWLGSGKDKWDPRPIGFRPPFLTEIRKRMGVTADNVRARHESIKLTDAGVAHPSGVRIVDNLAMCPYTQEVTALAENTNALDLL